MCGIAVVCKRLEVALSSVALARMGDEISYRGPDDHGTVVFTASGVVKNGTGTDWQVGLANRRLSILDLTTDGHQPMRYRRNLWISYNGEVYNYLEVKRELMRVGHTFDSGSDTEVILAAYAEWGTECFRRFRGMWALAIFDTNRREIVLSRDRLGIKPLYRWTGGGLTAYASEIKQFRHVPCFKAIVSTDAAIEYLLTGYEDPAVTLLQGVTPVRPGTYVRVDADTGRCIENRSYWGPEAIRPTVTDTREAASAFAEKFQESIRLHLRADVPVGCALSGGLDSSSIAAVMRSIVDERKALHSFTVTFPGFKKDERRYVDAVTNRLRIVPHYCTPDPQSFEADLEHFVWTHDEPVGSLSVYAAYCIARLTRQTGVPVTLNGQGGDELLGGYWPSYMLYLRDLLRSGALLRLARHLGGALFPGGNPELLVQIPYQLHRYRIRERPRLKLRMRRTGAPAFQQTMTVPSLERRLHEMTCLFLPRLLKWEDRNSMAFSIEGRYPFLDHELIELCLSFSADSLYNRGWTKCVLRRGLGGYLPQRILARKTKWGFEAPQSEWLRGVLKPHIEKWLNRDQLLWSIVDRADVTLLAHEIRKGSSHPRDQELFRLFMFHKWADGWGAVLA